jgi:predicted nuclease of predicted toxin-antitoxin system
VRASPLMRLLLDECVPARLRRALPLHQVSTVVQEGWSGIKNGKLLALAATSFDAFITVDKNLPYQQNTATLPVAVLVLDAVSNELPYLLPLVPALEAALANLKAGSYALLRSEA